MRKSKTVAKVPFLAPDVETKIIPSPTDGWDAISPLAEMDPKRAPILINWVARPGYVEVRQGTFIWAKTGGTAPVETIMIYRDPEGETMFAAAGTVIYDVSTFGVATPVVTGLGSARWQYTNFTPSGANTVLQAVNGVDQMEMWSPGNTQSISNVTNATPIAVTTSSPTSLATGASVTISGIPATIPISDIANASSPIAVTTAAPTNLATGASVVISGVAATIPVVGATNTTPILVTLGNATNLKTGQSVTIAGVTGNTGANGTFVVTVVNANQFTLNGSTGTGAYLSGGTVTGNTAANGTFTITVVDSTHFTLNGTTSNGVYEQGTGSFPGNTAANGTFIITKVDSTHFTLNGTVGNGAYEVGTGTIVGSFWSRAPISNFPAGITSTAQIINIYAAKQRLWYVFKNSTIAGFMPAQAVIGPLAGFQDFGPLFTKGGYLVAVADWTVDGGNGPQDYVVFISSRGQIALYAGTDPTNAAAWTLVGVFNLAPPLGYRCAYSIGSDVALITQQGVIPISQALPFDPSADRSVAITARIQNAMATAAQNGATLFGWQLMTFPLQQLLFLNVPIEENESQQQYVMNTLTGAWSQFKGWNSNCMEIFENDFYWGDNSGNVWQGYSGYADGSVGVEIDMQCAFNWFDEPGKEKRMTMIQPLLTTQGNVSPVLEVDTDFATSTAIQTLNITAVGVLWDSAVWDQSLWPAGTVNYTQWLTVEAIGHAFAARIHATLPVTPGGFGNVFDIATFDNSSFDGSINGSPIVLQVNAFNAILETGGAI